MGFHGVLCRSWGLVVVAVLRGAGRAWLVGKADDTLATVTRSRLPRGAANACCFEARRGGAGVVASDAALSRGRRMTTCRILATSTVPAARWSTHELRRHRLRDPGAFAGGFEPLARARIFAGRSCAHSPRRDGGVVWGGVRVVAGRWRYGAVSSAEGGRQSVMSAPTGSPSAAFDATAPHARVTTAGPPLGASNGRRAGTRARGGREGATSRSAGRPTTTDPQQERLRRATPLPAATVARLPGSSAWRRG